MQLRLPVRPIVLSLASVALLTAAVAQSVFADARDFTLVNNSSAALREVYVAAVGSSDWEENILGSDVLVPGNAVDVTFPDESQGTRQLVGVAASDGLDPTTAPVSGGMSASVCAYNIKVVGNAGEVGFIYGVDLCSTSTVTFSDSTT